MSKHFFIASFQASMRSQMFSKIDIPENSAKLPGNHLYQTLLTPAQIFFWEFLEIFRKLFLQNTSERLLLISIPFQFHLFTVLRRFCFRTDQYLFNVPGYFGVFQNLWPPAHWAAILFMHRINAIDVKTTPVFKAFIVSIS